MNKAKTRNSIFADERGRKICVICESGNGVSATNYSKIIKYKQVVVKSITCLYCESEEVAIIKTGIILNQIINK